MAAWFETPYGPSPRTAKRVIWRLQDKGFLMQSPCIIIRISVNKYLWIIPFASFLTGYAIMSILYQARTTQTPALVGKTIQEALRITAAQGLSMRLVDEQEDPELPAGIVIAQNPLPNTHMKTHQAINCVISKKTDHRAPQLTGKNIEEIQHDMEEKGINLKVHPITSSAPQEMCIAQDPAPNTIMSTKTMTVYISQGNAQQFLFPNLCQKSVEDVQSFLASAPVIVQVSHPFGQPEGHSCSQCIVSDQRPRAGTIVYLDKQKPIHVQLIATPVVNAASEPLEQSPIE